MEKPEDHKQIVSQLFDEFDKIQDNKAEGQVQTSIFGFSNKSGEKPINKFLKDASEIEK